MTDTEYRKLEKKSIASMLLGNFIAIAISAVFTFLVLTYLPEYSNEYISETDLSYIMYAFFAIVSAYLVIGPFVFYARYRYMISDERTDVKRGILIIRRTMVPIERIHQVEVTRGPINNIFGLANVQITTAGGVANIEYLKLADAEEIAKHLNAVVNRIVKGLRNDQ